MDRLMTRLLALLVGMTLITGYTQPVYGAAARPGVSAWSYTIIDHGSSTTSGPAFADPSIAIDKAGHSWISYTANDGTLKVASKLAANWILQTVDSSLSTGWSSLALNQDGIPQISYQFSGTKLNFTHLVSTTWPTQEIDSTQTGGSFTGDQSSLDLDSSGTRYVAYLNNIGNTEGDLWYATSTGGTWTKTRLDKTFVSHPTLKVDKQNQPHIGYLTYDDTKTKDIIRYRVWTGSAWSQVDWVAPCSDCLTTAAMTLDSAGNPYFIFADDLNYPASSIQVAHWNGSAWSIIPVDNTHIDRPSIAMDQADHPYVCYLDKQHFIQKSASWDGVQWQTDNIWTNNGGDCSITVDAAGGLHVAFVDYSRRLIYMEKPAAADSHKVFLAYINQN